MLENAFNMIAHNPPICWATGGAIWNSRGRPISAMRASRAAGARKMLNFFVAKQAQRRQAHVRSAKIRRQTIALAGSFKGMCWALFDSLPPRSCAAASARAEILESFFCAVDCGLGRSI